MRSPLVPRRVAAFRFLILAGATLLGLPNVSAQQAGRLRHIGVLLVGMSVDQQEIQEFLQGLRELGHSVGGDVAIEWRTADGDYERVPKLAADLVQHGVDVIVVDGTVGTHAAKRATTTIPIIMANVADPIGSGLVSNLAHPEGNVTGFSNMLAELSGKRLQLLKDTLPQTTRVAVLWNPNTPYSPKVLEQLRTTAAPLSVALKLIGVRVPKDIQPAVTSAVGWHAQALYIVEDPVFTTHRATVLKLVSKAKLPTMYGGKQWTQEGGLMSYGANYGDLFRRSAGYADRILRGAKPADLPVEQPIKFELVLNQKAATALGIAIPESILFQADEVIR